MTTETEINQHDVPVTPNRVTNWNGEDVSFLELPEYQGEVGSEVLDEVENLIDEFVFLTPYQRTQLTLWAAHANVFNWFRFTPCLGITAGDAECGKSQALLACRMLTNNSLWIGDASGASFFTQTQHGDKAVFLDEMQDMMSSKESKTLKAALKTGRQSNGVVTRVDLGTNGRTVRRFGTFAAVGFDGKAVDRYVDSQMHSRTHWIYMRKAFSDEQRELLDERFEGERFKEVGGRLLKWLHQNEQEIKAFKTSDLPPYILNRGRQKWLPLFAIAHVAGGKWLKNLHQLADQESAISNELSDGTQLLLAIQDIEANWSDYSNEPRDSKIAAWKLAELLTKWKDESGLQPYARFHKAYDPEDRHITKEDLFKLLRPYARPKRNRSRFDKSDRSSGYEWWELLDQADRNLPDEYRLPSCHADVRDKEVA
jgi:hypothetical protein